MACSSWVRASSWARACFSFVCSCLLCPSLVRNPWNGACGPKPARGPVLAFASCARACSVLSEVRGVALVGPGQLVGPCLLLLRGPCLFCSLRSEIPGKELEGPGQLVGPRLLLLRGLLRPSQVRNPWRETHGTGPARRPAAPAAGSFGYTVVNAIIHTTHFPDSGVVFNGLMFVFFYMPQLP